MTRVAFLGPPGTFTEAALLTQPDLAGAELVPVKTMPEVLELTERGEVDLGFVALENSIDGTVNESLDSLIFETDLLIQREVVLSVRMNLLGVSGADLAGVRRVVSIQKALAQCRGWLTRTLPDAEILAANSTAEAAKLVSDSGAADMAAVGNDLAAKLYSLDVLAADIEDHPDNSTRFVLVRPKVIPPATGHDKTSIVCFQHADRPGSLHAILGQFSARNINLTKLESRPTKRGLGEYCFIIDLEGHVQDEVVADCLRDLHAQLAGLKFLGSYPAAGEHGETIRREAEVAWKRADEWLAGLRGLIGR
jgi:prephenate dehydratase